MILVTGSLVAKGEHLAEALRLSLEHVHRSRLEPGCVSHCVHQDAENPSRLVFLEEWTDEAALTAHFAVPATRTFARTVSELAEGSPQIAIYEAKRVR
jgi:quinol monooxygenase YgiN